MFCLAGLGAAIEGMIQTAKDADMNVVIDGCEVDCARKIFDGVGIDNYVHVRVTDEGMEKIKGVRATVDEVATLVTKIKEAMTRVS